MRVGSFLLAISAQAMTVFPDPGGATSTPDSCDARARKAAFLGGQKTPREPERNTFRYGAKIGKLYVRARPLRQAACSVKESPRQYHRITVIRQLCGADIARRIPGGEAHALQFEEFGVGERCRPLECRDQARRQTANFNLEMTGKPEGDGSRVRTPDLFVCHVNRRFCLDDVGICLVGLYVSAPVCCR